MAHSITSSVLVAMMCFSVLNGVRSAVDKEKVELRWSCFANKGVCLVGEMLHSEELDRWSDCEDLCEKKWAWSCKGWSWCDVDNLCELFEKVKDANNTEGCYSGSCVKIRPTQ